MELAFQQGGIHIQRYRKVSTKILFICLVLVCISCDRLPFSTKKSPYESYKEDLKKADLLETSLGKKWVEAGLRGFEDTLIKNDLPLSETGFFDASTPDARYYKVELKEGQILKAGVTLSSSETSFVFVDLFLFDGQKWSVVAFADTSIKLTHEVELTGSYLLRIQPRLLVNAAFVINAELERVLKNPVLGATNKSVWSFYGDPRDGGKRKHEGIDIFAPKGTPVIAPADGQISRLRNGGLGGKSVWMRDSKRNQSYYFAHLDSQLVQRGQRVQAGDTLGLVGNTGNAKHTPAHLHFGIYQRGSIDPYPFVKVYPKIAQKSMDTSFRIYPAEVSSSSLNLRAGPEKRQSLVHRLKRDDYLSVIGKTEKWLRVRLPDQREGYVYNNFIRSLQATSSRFLADDTAVYFSPFEGATEMLHVMKGDKVEVLAQHDAYIYVQTPDGSRGWIHSAALSG